MAQYTRTKKITDDAYSPTVATSEGNIRAQVDGSIEEVFDMLYSTDVGKGASQVGINGSGYPDLQTFVEAVETAGTGTLPPANSVVDNMLSDTAGQIKDRVDTNTADIATLNLETTQLDWQVGSVTSRTVTIVKPTDLKSVKFQLEADIDTGAVIQISDGTTSLPLKDIDEVDILELEKGFYEVIADATFFTLRPKGGTSFGAYVKYPGLITISQLLSNSEFVFGDPSQQAGGQTFTTLSGDTEIVRGLSLYLSRVGSPTDSVTVSIYNVAGGFPTGAALATETILGSTLSSGASTEKVLTFGGSFTLSPSTQYVFTVDRTGAYSSSNYYRISKQGTDVYAGGNSIVRFTTTWSSETRDVKFVLKVGDTQATLKTDGADATVKTGQYILANYSIFIDDGGTGQTIPSIDNATNETELKATVNGTLKTDATDNTAKQVIASVFKNSQGFTTL